jgi:hypothetical protein
LSEGLESKNLLKVGKSFEVLRVGGARESVFMGPLEMANNRNGCTNLFPDLSSMSKMKAEVETEVESELSEGGR